MDLSYQNDLVQHKIRLNCFAFGTPDGKRSSPAPVMNLIKLFFSLSCVSVAFILTVSGSLTTESGDVREQNGTELAEASPEISGNQFYSAGENTRNCLLTRILQEYLKPSRAILLISATFREPEIFSESSWTEGALKVMRL